MNKKKYFAISIVINIILAFFLAIAALHAADKLHFEYVVEETIRPDSIRSNLDRENYGSVAFLSRAIRGGAEVDPVYLEYYRLGEYTDLMFMKKIYEEAGNVQTLASCEERLSEIREEMPEYSVIFDKIDSGVRKAVIE